MTRVRKSAFGDMDSPPTALRRQKCQIVRAELDGKLIAYALSYEIVGEQLAACLDEVAVHARYQYRRVGSVVAGVAVAWMRERNVVEIYCTAIDPRLATILERLGVGGGIAL
jgi:GNAT superfamily N-acetyltransferase